jgi:hypothetical protein
LRLGLLIKTLRLLDIQKCQAEGIHLSLLPIISSTGYHLLIKINLLLLQKIKFPIGRVEILRLPFQAINFLILIWPIAAPDLCTLVGPGFVRFFIIEHFIVKLMGRVRALIPVLAEIFPSLIVGLVRVEIYLVVRGQVAIKHISLIFLWRI